MHEAYLHGHENILINNVNIVMSVVLGIATSVNDSHLLDECRFARFARTCNSV